MYITEECQPVQRCLMHHTKFDQLNGSLDLAEMTHCLEVVSLNPRIGEQMVNFLKLFVIKMYRYLRRPKLKQIRVRGWPIKKVHQPILVCRGRDQCIRLLLLN